MVIRIAVFDFEPKKLLTKGLLMLWETKNYSRYFRAMITSSRFYAKNLPKTFDTKQLFQRASWGVLQYYQKCLVLIFILSFYFLERKFDL